MFAALPKAQQLGDWATDTLRAPIFSLVEGYGYAGDPAALKDLTETEYNRAGVVLGDTAASSKNAAMGVVARAHRRLGRPAENQPRARRCAPAADLLRGGRAR